MFLRSNRILLIMLAFAALLFVACEGDDAAPEGGGGGLTEGYPLNTAEAPILTPEDQILPATEEVIQPEITATAAVEVTSTVEMTETATGEVTAESTAEIDVTAEAEEETFIVLANELIGMSIQNGQGTGNTELGTVAEVLIDDTGAIQYVVMDVSVDSGLGVGTSEPATPEATATGQSTDTDGLMTMITVAIPWNSFQVDSDTAAQGPPPVGTPETTGSNQNDANENDDNDTNANENNNANDANENDNNDNGVNNNGVDAVREESGPVKLIYSSESSLDAEPSFDIQILDEQGFILDEEGSEGDETAVPAEYANLLQISEYGTYEIQNVTGEKMGRVADLLINLTLGRVDYVIVDVDDRMVPIPWNRLQVEVTMEDETEVETMMLPTTADMLTEAPDIELSDWQSSVDPEWDADYRTYWETNLGG